MKGIINTDNLLHAILDKEKGLLPKGKILTHLAVMEIPTYHKLLFLLGCCGHSASHSTTTHRDDLVCYLYLPPLWHRATACRLDSLYGKSECQVPHSLDYVNIVELAEAGEFGNVIIDGPLDVRTACEQASGDIKGIVSPINGQADV